MNIVTNEVIDLSMYGKTSTCVLRKIHVQINDTHERLVFIVNGLRDASWITNISKVSKRISYGKRAEETIHRLVREILSAITSNKIENVGEYLISFTAQDILETEHSHLKIPLAELWKEQIKRNPGFDFHTVSNGNLLFFGEAKYTSAGSPYSNAMAGINGFLKPEIEKHKQEISDLEELGANEDSIVNVLVNNKFGVVAAFSLNAINIEAIFERAISLEVTNNLLDQSEELFLIGIEICS